MRTLGPILALWLCTLGPPPAQAAAVDAGLPSYVPQALAGGNQPVLIYGYNDMKELLEPLVAQFATAHPGLRPVLDLPGTRFAPAALAAGRSALAPMGAQLTPAQRQAYLREAGHEPIEIRVAHASLDPRALSGPLGIFVHADNPLAAVTLAQLRRVFSGEIRRWGELGVTGVWAEREVHAIGLQSGTALFFAMRDAVQAGDAFGTALLGLPQSAQVVEHAGSDPLALGFAAAMRLAPGTRRVAVARDAAHEALLPTEETITSGRYPLDRHLLVYARRPLTPVTREFMRLMLSRDGQQAVAATPQRYLPLSAAEAAIERSKLDSP